MLTENSASFDNYDGIFRNQRNFTTIFWSHAKEFSDNFPSAFRQLIKIKSNTTWARSFVLQGGNLLFYHCATLILYVWVTFSLFFSFVITLFIFVSTLYCLPLSVLCSPSPVYCVFLHQYCVKLRQYCVFLQILCNYSTPPRTSKHPCIPTL